ncbi:unnamed protein product, partial [Polarella glacialis]
SHPASGPASSSESAAAFAALLSGVEATCPGVHCETARQDAGIADAPPDSHDLRRLREDFRRGDDCVGHTQRSPWNRNPTCGLGYNRDHWPQAQHQLLLCDDALRGLRSQRPGHVVCE